MDPERRQSQRKNLDSLVYLNLEPGNGGILVNLCEKGMQISAANPLQVSQEISFSLSLAPMKRISGAGRVTWLSPSGKSAGVSFNGLNPDSLKHIRHWMENGHNGHNGHSVGEATIETAVEMALEADRDGQEEQHVEAVEQTDDVPIMFAANEPAVEATLPQQDGATALPTNASPEPPIDESVPNILSLYEIGDTDGQFTSFDPPAHIGAAEPQNAPLAETQFAVEYLPDMAPTPLTTALQTVPEPDEHSFANSLFLDGLTDASSAETQVEETKEIDSPPGPVVAVDLPWPGALSDAGFQPAAESQYAELPADPAGSPEDRASRNPEADMTPQVVVSNDLPETPFSPLTEEVPESSSQQAGLYLPNYELRDSSSLAVMPFAQKREISATPMLAAKVASERFEALGWGLERDWHVWVGLILAFSGLLALAQKPPLVLLAVAFWVAGAVVLLSRKQPIKESDQGPVVGHARHS